MTIEQLYELYREHPVVTTDSRDCPAGSIFVALKGASFNGNHFARAAIEKGCAYAVVDEAGCCPEGDSRYILVDDGLKTLQLLARHHRRQFDIPVIGITGTNGKTTTKELIHAVLAEKYSVLATEGNFNNDIGVPKTLFRLDGGHEVAVVEMGASHPGDIRRLVETAEPTCGIITNVGRAHLQGFGSFEGVKQTKGELYDFLACRQFADTDGGFVFINEDDADLVAMAGERGLIFQGGYGMGPSDDVIVKGRLVKADPLLTFEWCMHDEEEGDTPWQQVSTRLIGTYNIYNMLAAVTVGLHFDVSPRQISHALAAYQPTNNRSQLNVTAHNRLVVDAYNANPTSMAAAIDNFNHIDAPHKMAILGDMRELGEASEAEHQRVADLLAQSSIETVWLVGEEFGKTKTSFRRFADAAAVAEAIAQEPPRGRLILIKGSNGIRLAPLADLL